MHYEIEILEGRVWQSLTDEKGKVVKFTRFKIVGKRALQLSQDGNEVRIRQTLIKTIDMDRLKWMLKQTAN